MSARKILVTRMKFIGDVVLTTPLIRTLRAAYPDAHIAYLADARAITLLEHNPYLDELIPFDYSNRSILFQLALYYRLRAAHFDLAIDLFSNPRSALMTYATGAPQRIGGNARVRRRLYTHRIADDGVTRTAIDFHYRSLVPLGIDAGTAKTEIFLTEQERTAAQELLRSLGVKENAKTIAIHPGGTWPSKLWNREKFVRLAQMYTAEGWNVVVSGGAGDAEVVDFVCSRAHVPSIGDRPLRTVAAVLSLSDLAVSNDCGIMHIAVAVGTTTIGLFGPGQEEIWFPYSAPHLALRKDVPCHPCHLNVCNREGDGYMECMNLLSVEEVFRASKERL